MTRQPSSTGQTVFGADPVMSDQHMQMEQPTRLSAPPIAPSGVDLHAILRSPEGRCDLDSFVTALSIRDIHFECEGDGPLAQHPAFPGAVRQGIGSELMKTASREALAGLPCPWTPACGMHVFFTTQGNGLGPGQNDRTVPPPWLIQTETTGANSLRITLRLFGLGLLWGSELADACHRAIEKGIHISGKGPVTTGVLIRSVETVWTGLDEPCSLPDRALVSFTTPFRAEEPFMQGRQADSSGEDETVGAAFLRSLQARSAIVARWHGLSLADQMDTGAGAAPFAPPLSGVGMDERGLSSTQWARSVSQKGGEQIAMAGHMGVLQLSLTTQDSASKQNLVRLLQIGALLHVGGNTAFGQGRYDLFLS